MEGNDMVTFEQLGDSNLLRQVIVDLANRKEGASGTSENIKEIERRLNSIVKVCEVFAQKIADLESKNKKGSKKVQKSNIKVKKIDS